MNKIRVVIARPGDVSKEELIDEGLKSLQKIVGGPIQAVRIERRIIAYINEDGLGLKLPWNRQVGEDTYISGVIVAVGMGIEGSDRSLTDTEVSGTIDFFDNVCKRMDPTPSSFEEVERLMGRPAIVVTTGQEVLDDLLSR